MRRYIAVMKTNVNMKNRSRGRPPHENVRDRLFQMRIDAEFLRVLDDWRSGERPIPSRAEAIRRLILAAAKRHEA
jgi:hypothetical protein